MISFVLLGAVSDPRNVPTTLIILFLAAMAGGIAWLAGLQSGKSSEWGVTGVLLGVVIGVGATFYNRESSAVVIDSGNLSMEQVSGLRRQRYMANSFVQMAFLRTHPESQTILPGLLFGFLSLDATTQDVVLGEVLRREADELGIVISTDVVTDFIKSVSNDRMTSELFTEIRTQLRVTEQQLLDALRDEIKAREALQLLYGRNYLLPQSYWEFYKKLNVRQSAELVAVPVKDFVDVDVEPVESELQELFVQYRGNFPDFTEKGQLEEGRPGFRQPRRFRLGYFEAAYDDIEPLVGGITDEEIEQRYEEQYEREMPATDPANENLDLLNPGPELRLNSARPGTPESSSAPATEETPTSDAPEPDSPEPATSNSEIPESEAPANETLPKTSPEPESTEPTPEAESNEPENSEAAASEELSLPAEDADAEPVEPGLEERDSTSVILDGSSRHFIAFFDDDQNEPAESTTEDASEAPATDGDSEPSEESATDAASSPNDESATGQSTQETPAPESSETPEVAAETDIPSSETPPSVPTSEPIDSGESPATSPTGDPDPIPPAPTSQIRPLDEDLKQEIREDLLREKTQAEIQARVKKAYQKLSDISYHVQLEESADGHLTLDAARKMLESYADENGLVYLETPQLSYEEMRESEDFGIGRAINTLGSRQAVPDALFQTSPMDLYSVSQADRLFPSESGYAYWKLEDREAYVPETYDESETVKEQVVDAWRKQQATPVAQTRAEELANMVKESTTSMSEALSGEKDAQGLFLNVLETGDFTWMQRSSAPSMGLQQQQARLSVIPGVEDAGMEFFEAVFNEIAVGEVGIASNRDKSVLYVVRVRDRSPDSDEELAESRDAFLAEIQQRENMQNQMRQLLGRSFPDAYTSLEGMELQEYNVDWVEKLWDKHSVQLLVDE